MRNRHLTLEEHIKLGEILKPLCDDIVDLAIKINNRQGTTKKSAKIIDRISKDMSKLKSELENEMFVDYKISLKIKDKENSKYSTNIYYGDRTNTNRFKFIDE